MFWGNNESGFEEWCDILKDLLRERLGHSNFDAEAWREDWENNLYPEEALAKEYPAQ